jgi:hypothetical protein
MTYRLARLDERFARLEAEVSAFQDDAIATLQSDMAVPKLGVGLPQCWQQSTANAQNKMIATLGKLETDVRILKIRIAESRCVARQTRGDQMWTRELDVVNAYKEPAFPAAEWELNWIKRRLPVWRI